MQVVFSTGSTGSLYLSFDVFTEIIGLNPVDLGQKCYATQVRPNWDLNS